MNRSTPRNPPGATVPHHEGSRNALAWCTSTATTATARRPSKPRTLLPCATAPMMPGSSVARPPRYPRCDTLGLTLHGSNTSGCHMPATPITHKVRINELIHDLNHAHTHEPDHMATAAWH